jgi:ketosteroid isomerase-like protein
MKTICILLFLAAFSSVTAAQSNSKAEADILKVMDDQAAAWNRGDIDSFMRGYWHSDDLVFVSGDTVTHGWQKTLDNYKAKYSTRAIMGALRFSDVTINLVSKDAAVVLGSWSLAREKDNPHGKFTLIFRKMKDGWRIVHDHTS